MSFQLQRFTSYDCSPTSSLPTMVLLIQPNLTKPYSPQHVPAELGGIGPVGLGRGEHAWGRDWLGQLRLGQQ